MTTGDHPEAAGAVEDAPSTPRGRRPGALGRRVRRWTLELLLFAGIFAAASAWQERNLLATHRAAPNFDLETLDGEHVSLASLHGKRVLLHFWATWCGVCQAEHGALNAVEQSLGPDEAVYAIVADSDDPARVRRFVADEHLRYPVLLGTSNVLRDFRVGAFPTNYYLDAAGRVASHTVGISTRFAMRARLALAK